MDTISASYQIAVIVVVSQRLRLEVGHLPAVGRELFELGRKVTAAIVEPRMIVKRDFDTEIDVRIGDRLLCCQSINGDR
jgi:hypothetical protein